MSERGEKRVKGARREQILETLARELEDNHGKRITTSTLASAVGVSEAALYRHFPSKAKMFEGLIDFIEETVFGLIGRIGAESQGAALQSEQIIALLLTFSEKNPGMTRILVGDALIGEHERLQQRVGQFFERIETELKQILRQGDLNGELQRGVHQAAAANLMLSLVEGRMHQFVRSQFRRKPTV
ncbi:MAG: nucleoid occlusion factor SlmA, partial [Gammaproteobacteria bacterium]|nr:nucleoid occlusion factor SlmA [Gammaproteobacteria bacterium]